LRTLITLLLLLVCGCVQVPGDAVTPRPVPSPSVPDEQFAGVDETLVTKILQSSELQDPLKLRTYAALYRGISEAVQEPGVSVMQVLQGGMKTTEQFVKPRSPQMQAILVAHMPKPPLAESDRQRIVDAFAAMGQACHAAAHRLENPTN
jgi:hypothetical protein